jgi:outer membrane scaffolding protein for murein synthesis (MipA/OmpV family)
MGARTPLLMFAYRFAFLSIFLWSCTAGFARAQTPSPLQEWQYSSGIILEKLFEPAVPDWSVVLGIGAELKPLYNGADQYRVQAGPVINIRYSDIAFASTGEGLGVNIWRGDNYRFGVALGYDLGREVSEDESQLHGLGDINKAPVAKVFGSYVISKDFPLVLRANFGQIIGGADGLIGDFGAYMPLPGSSKTLFMFAGPSVTFADQHYMQKEFGVTASQAEASGYRPYYAHAGFNGAGFGFSGTKFITDHWLINLDLAVSHLLGSATQSPITQKAVQPALSLSIAYDW